MLTVSESAKCKCKEPVPAMTGDPLFITCATCGKIIRTTED